MMSGSPSPPISGLHSGDLEIAQAALDGSKQAAEAVLALLRGDDLKASLCQRGATATEADDIVNDMIGDCYGGERAKGGLHRLLGRYSGAGSLAGFLHHVALRRLISLKRKQSAHPRATPGPEGVDPLETLGVNDEGSEDAVVELLLGALKATLAKVNAEKLVVVRLIESYQVPQKQIGSIWGWNESKVSRAKSDLIEEIRSGIMEEVRRTDPWLRVEFDDFLRLCDRSSDLFSK